MEMLDIMKKGGHLAKIRREKYRGWKRLGIEYTVLVIH